MLVFDFLVILWQVGTAIFPEDFLDSPNYFVRK